MTPEPVRVNLKSEIPLDSVEAEPHVHMTPSSSGFLAKQFEMYDLEQSGSLDLASFLASIHSLRIPQLSDADVELIFHQRAESGRIDTSEFLALYETHDPSNPHHFFTSLIHPEESVAFLLA